MLSHGRLVPELGMIKAKNISTWGAWARLRKCGSGLVRLLIKGMFLGTFASRSADSPKARNILFFFNVKTP